MTAAAAITTETAALIESCHERARAITARAERQEALAECWHGQARERMLAEAARIRGRAATELTMAAALAAGEEG